jgi:hypothetical protein
MTTKEIQQGHVYRGADGRTRKVLSVFGRGRNRQVQFRTAQQRPACATIRCFAAISVADVTPPATQLATGGKR